MDPITLSIVAFVAVAAGIAAVGYAVSDMQPNKAEDRLQELTGNKNASEEMKSIMKADLIQEGVTGINGLLHKFVKRFSNISLLFQQANSPIGIETFAVITIVCAVVGVGVSAVANAPLPLYPVSGALFAFFPLFWMLQRRKRRFKKFAQQLPDAMELIARALRSGHSLASGLHVVVEEMPDPVSEEFGMAYEEQNLGVPLEVALKNIFARMPNLDFKFFVTAVAIQRQSGGDLAEILDKIGRIIRERFRIVGQVQALTGEGRISGIVLMALPPSLFFTVYFLNSEYVMLLFTEDLGRKMIGAAAVLQVVGAFAIKKIIEIKI